MKDAAFSFKYNQSVTITGAIEADGRLAGQGVSAATSSGGTYPVDFKGKLDSKVAVLQISSARCDYDVELAKTEGGGGRR